MGRKIVIEKTSKKWKGIKLIGLILMVGSIFLSSINSPGIETEMATEYTIGFTVGLVCIVYAVIGSWWDHG